jgi:hypothetical protein
MSGQSQAATAECLGVTPNTVFRIASGSFKWIDATGERVWPRLRRYVRERLGTRAPADAESATLALTEAQLLIAREHGFENWNQRVEEDRASSSE